jgi:hypothetical protein
MEGGKFLEGADAPSSFPAYLMAKYHKFFSWRGQIRKGGFLPCFGFLPPPVGNSLRRGAPASNNKGASKRGFAPTQYFPYQVSTSIGLIIEEQFRRGAKPLSK